MTKVVLVYERVSSAKYLYQLIGIILPEELQNIELPASPTVGEVETLYLDTIYDENDRKRMKELKENPEFIPLI